MEEHNEEPEVGSPKDDQDADEESEELDSSEMSSRGPRLRRLRPRCRMMEEGDFLNSSFSEEDEDEDSEYSEESDDYDEQNWNFPDEDNMGADVNGLKSQVWVFFACRVAYAIDKQSLEHRLKSLTLRFTTYKLIVFF